MFGKQRDIGIDLGTATVLIYCRGKGIVLREPSVAAIDKNTGEVVGVGYDAQKMLGRTPGHISAVRPLRNGVISDYKITLDMLEQFLLKWQKKRGLRGARVVICVPSGVTDVEQRAVKGVADKLGAKSVAVVEEPVAAANGAGIDIAQPRGVMIVDIGGGTADIAILSLGRCVISSSLKLAGDRMNEAIVRYLKNKHNLLVGERTAEMLKINIGTAYPRRENLQSEVMGRNLLTGLPKSVIITSEDIRFCLSDLLASLLEGIRKVLEAAPPELAADIIDSGICLTGGGSLLFGLDKLISDTFLVHCYVADDPESCVALGTGIQLENMDYSDPNASVYDYRKNY